MAQLFDDVFNPSGVYGMLFFTVTPVLTYPTIIEFEEKNKELFERWLIFSKKKYPENTDKQTIYEQNAIYHPEFSKAIAITYATVYVENGTLKRFMKKIVNEDEFIVLATFMDELYQLSTNAVQSSPHFFPILCGHNIINHDIPFLLKKHVFYRDKFNKNIPLILKRSLNIKPWESGIIDTINVWKFNGFENTPLMLISDFLGLKKTVDLLSMAEISQKYWEMTKTSPEKALEFVSLQSATQTNLVIQLMLTLRDL